MSRADEIIEKLNLKAHPEGGFYKETYRALEQVDAEIGERNLATVIYFLLKSDQKSSFHRLASDEFWYFHEGSPLEVFIIFPDGTLQVELLGADCLTDQKPQLLLPKGTWFGARCLDIESYSLISCSVSPGFQFDDFELANRDELVTYYPQHVKIIEELSV